MKKWLKWVYINKTPMSGIIALIFYFIESVYKISEKLCIPEGWYITFVSFLFVLIGYTINGTGFKGMKFIQDLIKEEILLKQNFKEIGIVCEIINMIGKENEDDNGQANINSS